MTSFIQKLRVITLGTVHDLLDKQIDMNQPTVVRQYIRDLEDALDKMRDEDARQAGAVRTTTREKGDLEAKIDKEKSNISNLLAGLAANKTEMARMKGTLVVQMQSQVASLQTRLQDQQKTSSDISSALLKLESTHTLAVNKLRSLEALDRDTKMKRSSADSVESINKVMNMGADISVDDIESRMKEQNDVQSVRFERAMDSTKTEEDPNTAAAVDDLLADLQPKEKVVA